MSKQRITTTKAKKEIGRMFLQIAKQTICYTGKIIGLCSIAILFGGLIAVISTTLAGLIFLMIIGICLLSCQPKRTATLLNYH